MSNYLVISADGHAGPPPDVYREYLDPEFRVAFDEHQASIETGQLVADSFIKEWDEETGDHDMKAGYDPSVRDAILDQEGVVAEVHRAAQSGLRGVMIPARWFDAPAYLDASYAPFWVLVHRGWHGAPHPLGRRAGGLHARSRLLIAALRAVGDTPDPLLDKLTKSSTSRSHSSPSTRTSAGWSDTSVVAPRSPLVWLARTDRTASRTV